MQHLQLPFRRRTLVAACAGFALVRPALAAPVRGAGGNDWLAQIVQHHRLIENGLKQLLAQKDWKVIATQALNVDQVINAHSFAEETVIYPAMVRAGMANEADKFYLAEAHVKVRKSPLELAVRMGQESDAWREHARSVQEALLPHARDEETDDFPKLHGKLSPQENQELTRLYTLHFSSVVPPVRR